MAYISLHNRTFLVVLIGGLVAAAVGLTIQSGPAVVVAEGFTWDKPVSITPYAP
jgi:hypothetical protein